MLGTELLGCLQKGFESVGRKNGMKFDKPFTLTGFQNPRKRLLEQGDYVDVHLVRASKNGPALLPTDPGPEIKAAVRVRGRVVKVKRTKDEEGSNAVQVTIEPL